MQSPQALMGCKGCRMQPGFPKWSRIRVVRMRNCSGQATVEFAIVCAALLCIAVGLAALFHLFDGGRVLQHALASASHHIAAGDAGAWGDILVY